MYRVVATNPNGTTYVIYDPVQSNGLPVLAPRLTEELNEAGSLEFSLLVGHPAFGNLASKQTYLTVTLDDNELFYGRLLLAEPNVLGGQIQYLAAGALSFLQDGEIAPDPRNEDGSYEYQTMTAENFFRRCIDAHNDEMGDDARRKFTVGIVNHKDRNKTHEFQINSYTNVWDVIRQNIIDRYGGFLRVRRNGNNGHFIDWVGQYGETDSSTLDIGDNILSITNRMNGEDLITAIRPIGKDGLVLSGSQTIDIFSASEMAKYGKIIRSVNLSAAETEGELREQANDLIANMHKGVPKSSDISMVDLHFTDQSQHGVNLGDVFTNIEGLSGESMTVATRNRDFENPQNDSVTLKNQKELEGSYDIDNYKSNSSSSSSSGGSISQQTARAGGAGGKMYKYIHEIDDLLQLSARRISINAEQLELHADMFVETANEFVRLSHRAGTLENEVGEIQGTGVIQNSEYITTLAGLFQYDSVNHRVNLINGTEFRVTEQGTEIAVGAKIKDLTEFQTRFEGSALWTRRDSITGVVGEFDIITNSEGVRTLRIKSGGGLVIQRDGAQFGVYDSGTLTAGVIVDKINGGSATIQASKIYLLGDTIANTITASYVKSKVESVSSLLVRALGVTGNLGVDGNLTVAGSISAGTGLTVNNVSVGTAINALQIVQDGNTYTLQKKHINDTSWSNVSVSFSRAVASWSMGWSGGTFSATANPQNQRIWTQIVQGTTSWDGNTATVPIQAIDSDNQGYQYNTGRNILVDATACYNAGASASAPTGATLSSKVTGTVWNVNIQRGGGFAIVGKQIDLSSAYSDARSGYYTKAQYDANYTSGRNAGYKEGWNECIGTIRHNYGSVVLSGYSTYANGRSTSLFVAPSVGASVATGSARVWRYGGSAVTRYSLPDTI